MESATFAFTTKVAGALNNPLPFVKVMRPLEIFPESDTLTPFTKR
jgi:hypothetical protein